MNSREGDIVKSGFLLKQSKFFKQWKRRWFVLTPQHLCSYEQENGHMASAPTEQLLLQSCSTVRGADEEVGRPNAFKVESADRTFYLIAETSQDKEAWIGTIGRQMVRPSVMIN